MFTRHLTKTYYFHVRTNSYSKKPTTPKYLFLIPIALITLHAFLMNGYYYAHRQLTTGTYLSSIFAKIDPSLFENSIYVQAVNRTNLRISLFYDICPLIIKYCDFETFAIVQAVISLFFVLAGIFTLTKVIFGNSTAGYLATILYTTELNNWTLGSPAPYLNFFHHGLPYAYPLTIWSMVFFFQRRFSLSFLLAGLSWNFHPMFTLFLLFSYFIYWIFNRKEFKPTTIIGCLLLFTLIALPALINAFSHFGSSSAYGSLWLKGVRWVAGYTCFPSSWPRLWLVRASMFFLLFICTLSTIPHNQRKKIVIFTVSIGILCVVGTLFADIYPISLIIKMSLWRSSVIYLILAISCIGYALNKTLDHTITKRFLVISIIVLLTGYLKCFKLYYLPFLTGFLLITLYENQVKKHFPFLSKKFSILFFTFISLLFTYHLMSHPGGLRLLLFFGFTLLFLLSVPLLERYTKRYDLIKHVWIFPLLFIVMFDCAVLYHKGGPAIYYHGRIQGKPDPWAEIQHFAKMHSEKDDLFIVPPYMNDFTTYSSRAILGDWAEGSTLLYLDNQFTQEWFARMYDLGCRPYNRFQEYNSLKTDKILKVARKYGAKFVVTKKPKTFALKQLYENKEFILYETTHLQ